MAETEASLTAAGTDFNYRQIALWLGHALDYDKGTGFRAIAPAVLSAGGPFQF